MVTLCLTSPHLDGSSSASTLTSGKSNALKPSVAQKNPVITAARNLEAENTRNETTGRNFEVLSEGNSKNLTLVYQVDSALSNVTKTAVSESDIQKAVTPACNALLKERELGRAVQAQRNDRLAAASYPSTFSKGILAQRREAMIQTLRAMGAGSPRRNRKDLNSSVMHYTDCLTDVRKDRYHVHKWRIKSGRILNTGKQLWLKPPRRQRLDGLSENRNLDHKRQSNRMQLLPAIKRSKPSVHSETFSKRAALSTVQEGKEKQFNFRQATARRSELPAKRAAMINRLRQTMRCMPHQLSFAPRKASTISDDGFNLSTFPSPDRQLAPLYSNVMFRQSPGDVVMPTEYVWSGQDSHRTQAAADQVKSTAPLPPIVRRKTSQEVSPDLQQASQTGADASAKKMIRFDIKAEENEESWQETMMTKRKYSKEQGCDISSTSRTG